MKVNPWVQRWRRTPPRQRLAIIVGGAVLVAWAVNLVALNPLRRRITVVREQIREAEEQLVEAVASQRDGEQVAAAFTAYQPYLEAEETGESPLAAVLSEVEAAIAETGVRLLNLKPAPAPADAAQVRRQVGVVLDGEAAPEQLARLLDRLQRSPNLLRVTELTVRTFEGRALRLSLVVSKLLLQP